MPAHEHTPVMSFGINLVVKSGFRIKYSQCALSTSATLVAHQLKPSRNLRSCGQSSWCAIRFHAMCLIAHNTGFLLAASKPVGSPFKQLLHAYLAFLFQPDPPSKLEPASHPHGSGKAKTWILSRHVDGWVALHVALQGGRRCHRHAEQLRPAGAVLLPQGMLKG